MPHDGFTPTVVDIGGHSWSSLVKEFTKVRIAQLPSVRKITYDEIGIGEQALTFVKDMALRAPISHTSKLTDLVSRGDLEMLAIFFPNAVLAKIKKDGREAERPGAPTLNAALNGLHSMPQGLDITNPLHVLHAIQVLKGQAPIPAVPQAAPVADDSPQPSAGPAASGGAPAVHAPSPASPVGPRAASPAPAPSSPVASQSRGDAQIIRG